MLNKQIPPEPPPDDDDAEEQVEESQRPARGPAAMSRVNHPGSGEGGTQG